MFDLCDRALDAAVLAGATYADCRVVLRTVEVVEMRNGAIVAVRRDEDEALGVRVIVAGAWGFAGSDRLDGPSAEAAARRAAAIARAAGRHRSRPVRLAEQPPQVGEYTTPVAIDPLAVPLERKVDLLLAIDAGMRDVPDIRVREASLESRRERRLFASTEGARTDQTITETGGGFDATAVSADEVQTRSYPNSFGRHQLCAGWEAVQAMRLAENAPRIAEEAAALLRADPCPEGTMTVILDGTQAALQVHESCGHPTELDRALLAEAAFAGTSFLTPDLRGSLRYGSDAVTLVADATAPEGLGTFGWDDEGVPAQRTVLVDRGMFTGYLSSRETAAEIGLGASGGTVRAESGTHLPIIRMTNVNLEPGTSSLEELIAGTEHGVYLETNRSWSIDDRRLNFQFGCQNGWEIRDGRRVRLVRNSLYSGITPEFWGSCDGVAGPEEWRLWGVVNCGKGEPMQVMHVGHGAAPARFRNVRVGASR